MKASGYHEGGRGAVKESRGELSVFPQNMDATNLTVRITNYAAEN